MKTNTNNFRCAGPSVSGFSGQLALVLALFTPAEILAQNYAVLHSVDYWPSRLVLCGSALYGPAGNGAAGLIFTLNPDGSGYQVLKHFAYSDGDSPNALVWSGTRLYGTTQNGGRSDGGTVFGINPNGTGFALLRSFSGSDGAHPRALVVVGAGLCGLASDGGISNYGTIFRLNSDGSGFQVLKQFTGPDGKWPQNLAASGTTLYGTTYAGGASNYGTVFRLESDGTGFQVLKDFAGGLDGNEPNSLVVSGSMLYGTTYYGGSSSRGNVFRLGTDGLGFTPLVSFNDLGTAYGSLSVVSNGVLYGTSQSGGTVFQLNTDGTSYQAIATGVGGSGYPVVLSGQTLYGLGSYAVSNITYYDVFAVPLPSDAPAIFVQPQGQVVEVGTSHVSFQVAASGHAPLNYQWWRNGSEAIGSATNAILQIRNVQPSQAGDYYVAIGNDYGAITSSPARLDVITPGTVPVSVCSEVALRAALKGTSSVTFACDGTLALGSPIVVATNTVLDGAGHRVTISGGNLTQLFQVSSGASLTLLHLTLASGINASGPGGAINNQGIVNATNCIFVGNNAWAPPPSSQLGANGSNQLGGAVFNLGTLNLARCSFFENFTVGGRGQWGMSASPMPGTPSGGGPGGSGGAGLGGAVGNLGSLTCIASLFASNSVIGGPGGIGGAGQSIPCVYPGNGGPGGSGGSALGAGLYTGGNAVLVNCTFAGNDGLGGLGGSGGSGGYSSCHGLTATGANGSSGGTGPALDGIYVGAGSCSMTNCTVAGNPVGGIQLNGGTVSLLNTLLAENTPASNCIGLPADLGHNLSSDDSCHFSNIGSLNNTDPLIAPLADNGGPTLTMALLPGSPCIDAGDPAAALPTDQRGFPRPAGSAADIGAFEWGSTMPTLTISRTNVTGLNILGSGNPGNPCRLLASPDLWSWGPIATNRFDTNGITLYYDTLPPDGLSRFYRLATP